MILEELVGVLSFVAWMIAAAVGFLTSLYNRHDAKRDLDSLGPDVQNGRRVIGEGWVRRETVRLATQGTALVAGLEAVVGLGALVPPTLVLMSALVTINTVLDFRQRRVLNSGLNMRHK